MVLKKQGHLHEPAGPVLMAAGAPVMGFQRALVCQMNKRVEISFFPCQHGMYSSDLEC